MTTTTDPVLRELQTTNELLRRLISGGAFTVSTTEADPITETGAEPDTSPARSRKAWTAEEHNDLLVLCKYYDDRTIAALLGRTPKAIEDRRLNVLRYRRTGN
jgi:hypothetical protein